MVNRDYFLMADEPTDASNHTSAIAKLLSQVNAPTLILILLTGGGNWFATQSTSTEQKEEIQAAIRQVKELHDALSQTESRQKEALENMAALLRGQTIMFNNQLEVLKKIDSNASKNH